MNSFESNLESISKPFIRHSGRQRPLQNLSLVDPGQARMTGF